MEKYFSKHYAQINEIDPNSEESIKKWYEDLIDVYDRNFMPYIESLENKEILELGCGIGGLSYYLKIKGITNYLGVDHSEEQLSICRKYVSDKVINSDALVFLSTNKKKYDLIILYDLIEHIKQDCVIEFIEHLYVTLSLNGQLILRTPNMGSLFGLRSRYIDFTHEVGFTEESIKQVFNQSEFSKVEVHNTYIGKKRLFAVKFYQRILEKLYNIRLSNIVTQDLILTASKDH